VRRPDRDQRKESDVIERCIQAPNDGTNYSSAVRSNDLIFVSGHLGTTAGGQDSSFEEQLRAALAGVLRAVEALGGSRGTLLKMNGYIANVADFPDYHRIYRDVLGEGPLPARTTVQIGGFEPPILVEMDAIAAVRSDG
jgi:enamine deaminase RidA (YjgF/YER057c/UK114 family)